MSDPIDERETMYAFKGDHIIVMARRAGPRRLAEVLSADHPDGHPPLWVRWSDTGEEGLLLPAADVVIERAGPTYPPE